jgi:cytochrome c553
MTDLRADVRVLLASLLFSQAMPTAAANLLAGKQKAMQCTPCHGQNGIAVNPDAPNLAGENPGYIERQLKAFRSGERKNEQMTIVAGGLNDQDIGDLAAWFAAIKVTAVPPEVK